MVIGLVLSGIVGSGLGLTAAVLGGQPLVVVMLTYCLSGMATAATFLFTAIPVYRA